MEKSPNIFFIRHGQTESNVEDRFTGQLETSLTDTGRAQAVQAANALKKTPVIPDIIYVSPLSRALETAIIICNNMGLNPAEKIKIIPELTERNSGALSGMTRDHVREMYSEEVLHACDHDYNARPPSMPKLSDLTSPALHPAGGESLKDVENRLQHFFENQLKQDAQAGKNVLVVGHQNNLRPLMKLALGLDEATAMNTHIPNATPIRINMQGLDARINAQPQSICASFGR